ncbi:MAG: hypothetical protein B6D61_02185 [Bacteroidetes bacterium 4484_249]|jgi:hypothetical protein|nr:MAG: hypothetical protein B6D61_02185 [Bacteroidetes bacterium 4484_249]
MEAIRTITKTGKDVVSVRIPESFKNKNLEIIILPVSDSINDFKFFSDKELEQFSEMNLSSFNMLDDEDYSKW